MRVEIADTDLGGVVYYGNYPRFLDRAVLAFRRHLGIPLMGTDEHMFMVRRLELDYRSPARFDDLLEVHLRVVKVGRASHVLEGRIDVLEDDSPRHVMDAQVVLAGVRTDTIRPNPLPEEIAAALRGSMAGDG
jgi:acyl-CoA thioester hydrolase